MGWTLAEPAKFAVPSSVLPRPLDTTYSQGVDGHSIVNAEQKVMLSAKECFAAVASRVALAERKIDRGTD